MADTVTKKVLLDNATHYAIQITNLSDGTGESAVVKADKSAIANASDGAEAASLDIESIRWCIDGMKVRLLWDHATDDVAMLLSNSGYEDFRTAGGIPGVASLGGLRDPRSSGGTGDLLLTTSGHDSGDTYDITIVMRKNPD